MPETNKKKKSKSGSGGAKLGDNDIQHMLNQIPKAKIDHVEQAQLLTETIGKEKKTMTRLSDLHLSLNDLPPGSSQIEPHFNINPYNKSNTTFFLLSNLFPF